MTLRFRNLSPTHLKRYRHLTPIISDGIFSFPETIEINVVASEFRCGIDLRINFNQYCWYAHKIWYCYFVDVTMWIEIGCANHYYLNGISHYTFAYNLSNINSSLSRNPIVMCHEIDFVSIFCRQHAMWVAIFLFKWAMNVVFHFRRTYHLNATAISQSVYRLIAKYDTLCQSTAQRVHVIYKEASIGFAYR